MAKSARLGTVKRILTVLVLLLAVALASACVVYFSTTPANDNQIMDLLQIRVEIPKGVTIDGLDVGGKTEEEARLLVSQLALPKLGTLVVSNGEKTAQLDMSSLVPNIDRNALVDQAILLGNSGTKAERDAEREQIAANGKVFASDPVYDIAPLKTDIERMAQELLIPAKDATIHIFTKEERAERAQALASQSPAPTTEPETEPNQRQAQEISSNIPEGMIEYIESVPGSMVDPVELYQAIDQAVQNDTLDVTLAAPTKPVAPEKNIEDIEGTFTLIASTTSAFRGSYAAPNRVFNITKGASLIDGHVLKPGEVFSFNDTLGPRNAAGGWKSAGAISEGLSVQEYGGGICQLSSTSFNSVLKADLKIIERYPHSWPLSYLPAGQDATISTGGPDFKFENNRDSDIVISASVNKNDNTLTVSIYGAPIKDNVTIKLNSKKVASISQPPSEVATLKSMAPGTSRTIRPGRAGSRYETYKEYYNENGELIKSELAYKTTYRAISSVIEKGPAAAPQPKPAATASDSGESSSDNVEVVDAPTKTKKPTKTAEQSQVEDGIPSEG